MSDRKLEEAAREVVICWFGSGATFADLARSITRLALELQATDECASEDAPDAPGSG